MSGGSLVVVLVVLVVVLVVLEFWLVLDVEELVVDLHPITHATNNAKTSAALWRGKKFILRFLFFFLFLGGGRYYIKFSGLFFSNARVVCLVLPCPTARPMPEHTCA